MGRLQFFAVGWAELAAGPNHRATGKKCLIRQLFTRQLYFSL
jgi:hypothetical protein